MTFILTMLLAMALHGCIYEAQIRAFVQGAG